MAPPQKLLGALQAATRVVELLGGAGAPRGELEELCGSFLADVQDSQARCWLVGAVGRPCAHAEWLTRGRSAPAAAARAKVALAAAAPAPHHPLSSSHGPSGPHMAGCPPSCPEVQVTLLELADRHQQPLPFQNSDCRQQLELLAARTAAEAAEAQLAAAGATAAAAAGAAAAGPAVAGPAPR